jgi:hypothetical protein
MYTKELKSIYWSVLFLDILIYIFCGLWIFYSIVCLCYLDIWLDGCVWLVDFYGFDCGESTASKWIQEIYLYIDSKPVFVFFRNSFLLWLKWLFLIKTNAYVCCYDYTGRLI